MDYIYYIATFAGGAWTGYLVGQFSSVKEMNRRLNALVAENREKQCEIDRLSDLVAKFQAKKPLRTSDGKFASKRAAKTAELREYVASKAVS